MQSSTIRSYLSAIKKVLLEDGYVISEDKLKLTSLTKACRLKNDCVRTRLQIRKGLLELLLMDISKTYDNGRNKQPYLELLYKCIFVIAYYGLLRIGELTFSEHIIQARNVHHCDDKLKILLILESSKTHGKESRPQQIRISGDYEVSENRTRTQNFCPFEITKEYALNRGGYIQDSDQFFVFSDNSPVKPSHVRKVLKTSLKNLGLNHKLYDTHSFRIGRATDLTKMGYSIEKVKRLGRWRSNVVYKYIRD